MTNKKTAALLLALLIAAGTVAGCSTYDTIPVNGSSSETSTADDSKAESQTESSDTETSATSESSSETSQPNSNSSEDANTSKEPSSKPNGDSSSDSSESSSSKPSSKPSSGSSSGSSSKPSSSGNSSSSQTSKPSSKPAHSHSYSSKVTKPTCTKQGYTTHTCSCGDSYTDSYTEATGHSWSEWKTVKKATTKAEGKKERTCTSCGKTETKSIAKKKPSSGGSTSVSGGHAITGARKAVYSYSGDHGDNWSSVNLVDLLNEERAKKGLCKLEWTADLLYQDYAENQEDWDEEFFVNGKFNPYNCSEVKNVLNAAQIQADRQVSGHGNGVYASCVSEVWGYGTIEQSLREAMKAYLDSPGHYDLLMSPGSHSVTAAYAIGKNGHVYTAITCGG